MGGNCESRSQNRRFCRRDVNCVKALAEIFDFVAGLVQRVPKKTNEVKSDLQNSTASQGDCSWEIFKKTNCKDWLNIGQILRLGNKFPRSG